MKFDELVQHLSEMALAGVHRATKEFGMKERDSKYKPENQGIAISRNDRLVKKLEAEFDPHNVLPPVHIVLHDIPHTKNVAYSRTVRKRASQLSTPDNIVLVVSPTLGGGGHPMSVYTILHNWGHMINTELALSVCKMVMQAGIDLVDRQNNEKLYDAFVDTYKSLDDDDGENALYDGSFGVIDEPHMSQVFALPSDRYDELVANMFYQYVKFGRVTLRFASRNELLPYVQKIQQMFDTWVSTQRGKVIYTHAYGPDFQLMIAGRSY